MVRESKREREREHSEPKCMQSIENALFVSTVLACIVYIL